MTCYPILLQGVVWPYTRVTIVGVFAATVGIIAYVKHSEACP